MPAASYRDTEWRAQVLQACIIVTCLFWFTYPTYALVAQPLADITAPDADDKSLPSSYGFWVRGNLSFFAPGVMNRTDMNKSSPTYMRWTPPPEWREYCIASSGLPMSACSYFQYEAFPNFMTAYYVVMYSTSLIYLMFRGYITCRASMALFACLKRVHVSDGLKSILTPWGCQKSPFCSTNASFRFFQCMIITFMFHSTSICAYITALVQPGFGLLESSGTGMTYFGSGWNEIPLMSPEEVHSTYIGWHNIIFIASTIVCPLIPGGNLISANINPWLMAAWFYQGGSTFVGPVASSFLSNQVYADYMADLMLPFFWNITYFSFMEVARKRARALNLSKADSTSMCLPPKNFLSLREWKTSLAHEASADPVMYMAFPGFIATYSLAYMSANNITDPRYLMNADQGMLAWLNFTHIAYIENMAYLVFAAVVYKFAVFRHLKKGMQESKHLIGAQAFKKQHAAIANRENAIYSVFFGTVLLFTVMMPFGMAMQVYGVKDSSSWPSPLNAVFNRPGAETNLLGAPVHSLLCKIVGVTYGIMGPMGKPDPTVLSRLIAL